MELRKEEFKPLLSKCDMVQQLFKCTQESARLRRQHIFSHKRAINRTDNNTCVSIEELYKYYKSVEEALISLEVTPHNSQTVLKLIKALFNTLINQVDQESLKKPIITSNIINFISLLIKRWNKYSNIMYMLLKTLLIFSVTAYTLEDPFCRLVPVLEHIMSLPNVNPNFIFKESIAWIIGNMSSDCPQFIKLISQSSVFIPQMIELIGYKYQSLRATCLWSLYCLAKSPLMTDKTIFASPLLLSQLNSILKGNKEKERAVWILVSISSYIIHLPSKDILMIIETLLDQLIKTEDIDYSKAILRCIGSFLASDVTMVKCVEPIASNKKLYIAIDKLITIPSILQECVWILSLLAADPKHCSTIGQSYTLLNFLQSQLNENTEYNVKKEILLTLYYLVSNNNAYVNSIGNEGVLSFCAQVLEKHMVKDVQMVMCILSIIDLVIDYLPDSKLFIKEIGGKVGIEKMIYFYEENKEISLLAQAIVQKLTTN